MRGIGQVGNQRQTMWKRCVLVSVIKGHHVMKKGHIGGRHSGRRIDGIGIDEIIVEISKVKEERSQDGLGKGASFFGKCDGRPVAMSLDEEGSEKGSEALRVLLSIEGEVWRVERWFIFEKIGQRGAGALEADIHFEFGTRDKCLCGSRDGLE